MDPKLVWLVKWGSTLLAGGLVAASQTVLGDTPWGKFALALGSVIMGAVQVPQPGQTKTLTPPLPLFLLALGALALPLSSCSHYKPITWPEAVKCAPSPGDVIGEVTQVLYTDAGSPGISDAGVSKLEKLAAAHGADTIICLVDTLLRDWRAPGAAIAPERLAAEARADSFLAHTGVRSIER